MKKAKTIPLLLLFILMFSLYLFRSPSVTKATETEDVTGGAGTEDELLDDTEDDDTTEDDTDEDWDEEDSDDEEFDDEESDEESETTYGITINKTYHALAKGDNYSLKATNTTGKSLIYKSSDKKIATVSKKGLIKAVKAGTVFITVETKDGYYKATCKVKVPGIALNKTSVTLQKGKTFKVLKSNASSQTLIYTSSKTKVATVSSSGKITAKKAGTTVVTVKSKDGKYSVTCKVTVK